MRLAKRRTGQGQRWWIAFLFSLALCSQASAQLEMQVGNAAATVGGSTTVTIFLTHGSPAQGFQTALTYDNSILTLQSMDTIGLDSETLLAPNTIEFFLTNIDNNLQPGMGWGAVAAIFDSTLPFDGQTLPAGTNNSLVNYRFDVANDPMLVNATTTLQLMNGLGPAPGISNVVTISTTSMSPTLVAGQLNIVDEQSFIRGDANVDNLINIADGIFLLQYLFNGGASPICFSAADVTDDGGLDISDFILLVLFQFLGGSAPSAPYPNCGVDPTMDALECSAFPSC